MKVRVLHTITGLKTGGAENMLFKLLAQSDSEKFEHRVLSLSDEGAFGQRIEDLGVQVDCLHLGNVFGKIGVGLSRISELRKWAPQVLQGWMYHGNFVAYQMARFFPGSPSVSWNIRCTLQDLKKYKRVTQRFIRHGARVSKRVDVILANSHRSRLQHIEAGYHSENFRVIPNGFDLEKFKPNREARGFLRKELGLNPESLVVGHVARFHPMKDHRTFLEAAGILASKLPNVYFVAIGREVSDHNPALVKQRASLGLEGRVFFLGEKRNVQSYQAGFDIQTLTSAWGEGFPNVLGEAMACEVPCVATDVGDSKLIIGETGTVVAMEDPYALSDAWERLLRSTTQERYALGQQARLKIEAEYSMIHVCREYESLFAELVG